MKVLHFSAHDNDTGGGLSAARIHRGLLARGVDSQLCAAQPSANPPPKSFAPARSLGLKLAEKITRPVNAALTRHVQPFHESGVCTGLIGYDIGAIVREHRPDLVHLHWLGGDSFRFASIADLPVPIVWRLPDMWTFCAVEQYQADAAQYRLGPTLGRGWLVDVPGLAWRNKAATYARVRDLTIACPSRWLAKEASGSRLLAGRPVEVVRTGCDTALFAPADAAAARAELGLPDEARIVLVGADSLKLPRKGVDLFLEALHRLAADPAAPQALMVASFGSHPIEASLLPTGIESRHLGRVGDRAAMARVYGAADVFVAPSRMENLANTVLESMACGTPVAAFRIGGMPDAIDHGLNGYLAEPFDTADLARGIAELVGGTGARERRVAARRKIESAFSLGQEIDHYLALYDRALAVPIASRARA
jgi:glycosyltransferase involved in cell wall biosynthesis